MDANDVITMARVVSLNFANRSDDSTLIEFAEAIAAAEREACAKVCDEEARQFNLGDGFEDHAIGAEYCADAIRARSNAQGEPRSLASARTQSWAQAHRGKTMDDVTAHAEAVSKLAEDAMRYRWLRNSALLIDQAGAFSPYVIQGQTKRPLDGSTLDRLVDLAMTAPNAK